MSTRSDFDVLLLDTMGDDHRVVQAAKVSTLGADSLNADGTSGLIKYLMKNRHGSPFEHCSMQWVISAPIFVWREFHRHRIASYNEESSRYRQLQPVFYVPPDERPMEQIGRPGHYTLELGDTENNQAYRDALEACQAVAYTAYQAALDTGIAREVARQCLPVSIYSTCYVTMNLRALMNFLSLRTADTALWEIRQVAYAMQDDFGTHFPEVHTAWIDNGRVAP